MKIEIDNVYLIRYGQDESIQSYLIEFDLMDNTIENTKRWEQQFRKIRDGRKLRIVINDEPEIITWTNDFCYTCREMIKSTDERHYGHHRMSDGA